MARLFYLSVAGAFALASLAFFLVSFAPLLSAAPFSPGTSDRTPAVSVNHFRKGDRLPLHDTRAARPDPQAPDGLQTQGKVPLGCDPAFSPVTSPALSSLYGRCMA
jgi:hypothetical protein